MGNALFHPRSILPAAAPMGMKVKCDISKKHIKTRRKTTSTEKQVLMKIFEEENNLYPNKELREKLGQQLGMTARQVQVWFQNQRSKLAKRTKAGVTSQGEGEEPPKSDASTTDSPAADPQPEQQPTAEEPTADRAAPPTMMQIEESKPDQQEASQAC